MKSRSIAPYVVLTLGLMLAACAPQAGTEAPQAPVQASPPAPPTAAAAMPTAAGGAAPTSEVEAAAPVHSSIPGEPPAGKGIVLGDQSSVSSLNKERALVGDRFTLGKFERPYNAITMDTYFPFLDIVSANFYPETEWVYVRITLVGPDENNDFPASYAIEIDSDIDGRGDLIIIVDSPSDTDWSTDGVQVREDRNADVGGENILNSDSEGKGDGFEQLVFDQGQGQDPDAAWARLSSDDPKSIEMAFKPGLLQGDSTYLAAIWAGTASLNTALFDINDHVAHEEAGEANPDFVNFHPIKGVAELDNTCRAAIGFTQSGLEPAVCPQG